MAPNKLDTLISRRGTFAAKIKNVQKFIEEHEENPMTESRAEMIQERLETLLVDLEKNFDDIMDLAEEEEIADHEEVYTVLEMQLMDLKSTIMSIRKGLITIHNVPSTSSQMQMSRPQSYLPKLSLPSFSGQYEEWPAFSDLFQSIVAMDASLAENQKLQYLKSSLKGEAAALIQDFIINNENYKNAWDKLVNRYNNEREIVFMIIKQLVDQPAVMDGSSSALQKLLDVTDKSIRKLNDIKKPVDSALLVYIIKEKLHPECKRQWSMTFKDNNVPTFEGLIQFLQTYLLGLQAVDLGDAEKNKSESSSSGQSIHRTVNPQKQKHHVSSHHADSSSNCIVCHKEEHALYRCPFFVKSSIDDKEKIVRNHHLCFNCLRGGHRVQKCTSMKCKTCGKSHHTLLHRVHPHEKRTESTFSGHTCDPMENSTSVLLATAMVTVTNVDGEEVPCRLLLDQGSQPHVISEGCMRVLGLERRSSSTTISGVGSGVTRARGVARIKISSQVEDFSIMVDALILPKVSGLQPSCQLDKTKWEHLKGLPLADPHYHQPGRVDILLGAEYVAQLLKGGVRIGPKLAPIAQETVLGWILSGRVKSTNPSTNHLMVHHSSCDVTSTLQKFWELEQVSNDPSNLFTPEEKACEEHFQSTHYRDEKGRYVVQLPFRRDPSELGRSREIAIHRLRQVERRLALNPQKYEQYIEFLREYSRLGHMRLVPPEEVEGENNYYLPHHAVIKESSTTTKLRVVFDASAKTSSGLSLNDILMVGPKIQDDLLNLFIRFRIHIVGFTADIEKMYRQPRVHPQHVKFQRIVWRESTNEPIQDYELETITYGTSSAPYSATRTLSQLAEDEKSSFPVASPMVKRDFYMDDLHSGSDGVKNGIKLQDQLIQILRKGGFELRKWASSHSELIERLPPEMRAVDKTVKLDADDVIKTLGIQWNFGQDIFTFTVMTPSTQGKLTRRTLLSDISKVFDPLGWLSPVTINAKILLQELWTDVISTKGWDEPVTESIRNKWTNYCDELQYLKDVKIKRCLINPQAKNLQLHGFCDASERAYAAAVFLWSEYADGTIQVNLVAAKTKVAPLKQVSLPRLELCGAVLLTRLVKIVQDSLMVEIGEIHTWTDSTIVLYWLAAHPKRWKTFVANRVSEIQTILPTAQWHHVASEDNPADCASRGISSSTLSTHPLWWHGPNWLRQKDYLLYTKIHSQNPQNENPQESLEERKVTTCLHLNNDETILTRYETLTMLVGVTACCFRFIANLKLPKNKWKRGPLSDEERRKALHHWIKFAQLSSFGEDILRMEKKGQVSPKSKLVTLNPWLDQEGVIRVGGRLRHSSLKVEYAKHQIILPQKHLLTKMIIMDSHKKYLHAGTNLLLATLRQKFWIICGRDTVRRCIKTCIRCFRHKPIHPQPMMGDLPSTRVNPSPPFQKCGVDYAGPLLLRKWNGKGHKCVKGYVALFICMVTKAVHLELVSSLTTNAFLAALDRFVSIRGKPSDMYSDSGRNFIGSNNQLKRLIKATHSSDHQHQVTHHLVGQEINWHFNPPSAPHFGGLWEAAIKSTKYHLRRVMGASTFTMEEMSTLLAKISACLNSRPLCPLSNDPNDLDILTPGHFLIGRPLNATPERDWSNSNLKNLNRWQLVQYQSQQFWNRWSKEYLSQLQERSKWTKSSSIKLRIGDLVLLKDNLQPTLKWKMGRITLLHPGADGIIRVVTIQTVDGEIQRPIVKICPLPLDLS